MKIVSVNIHLPLNVGVNSSLVQEVKSLLRSKDKHLEIETVVYGRDLSIRPDVISAIVYNAQPAVVKMEGEDVVGFVLQVEQAIISARQFDPVPTLARTERVTPVLVGAN
jgi:hypothetical protein